jgi:hypothetical protein
VQVVCLVQVVYHKTLYVLSGQRRHSRYLEAPFDGAVPFSLRNVDTSGFGRARSLARVNDERGRGWWMMPHFLAFCCVQNDFESGLADLEACKIADRCASCFGQGEQM